MDSDLTSVPSETMCAEDVVNRTVQPSDNNVAFVADEFIIKLTVLLGDCGAELNIVK